MNNLFFKGIKEKLSDENESWGENSSEKDEDFNLNVEVIARSTTTETDFKMNEIKTESDLKSKMEMQESKTNGMIMEAAVYPGAGSTRAPGVNALNRNVDAGSNSSNNSFLPRIQSSGGVGFSNTRFGASNREGYANYMHNIPQGPTPFCRGGPPLRFRMTPRPVLSRITFPVRGRVWQPDGDDDDDETIEDKDEIKKEENDKADNDAKKQDEGDNTETEPKKQEDEEDIDLYGDIVTAADKSDNSVVDDEQSSYSALGPPPVPPAFLLNLDENVEPYATKINDKSEEYDPAEPWDSEDEMVIDENKEQTPERKEMEGKIKTPEEKKLFPNLTPPVTPIEKSNFSTLSPCKSTSPIIQAQKLSSPVTTAARSVFPNTPKTKVTTGKLTDDDDDDCPIFSIYSKATKKFSLKDDEERRLRSISVESENQILETKENKKVAKEKAEDKDLSWKKPSKKDKNYREGKKKSKERCRSKSYERKQSRSLSPKKDKKRNKERKKKTERKKELERYDVRKIVKNKEMRKTDAFGRDISKSRSISRSPTAISMKERSRNILRRRSRSLSRSRSFSRSFSRSRSRSRSFRRRSLGRRRYNRSRSRSRSESMRRSYSRSKSRSRSRKSKKKFKPKERMKFKSRSRGRKSRSISRGRRRSISRSRSRSPRVVRNKKRVRRSWSGLSRSPSFSPTRSRSVSLSPLRVRRSYSRSVSTSWSRGRSPIPRAPSLEKLTVVLTTKNKKKKKKEWKKRSRKEEKKRKRVGNSKEVFTSGDNVLVSVNFNNGISDSKNSHLNSTSPEPAETRKKRKGSDNENEKVKKKSNTISKKAVDLALSGPPRVKKLTRLSEKDAEVILNRKPVAVIDLDMSPYREQTPSPVNVVVVSDSGSGDEGKEHSLQPINPTHKGPNTPPAPRGPTTPKTPPSPQTSPDAYDPFEPTKSRSLSPSQADKENRPSPKPADDQTAVGDEGNEMVSSSSDKIAIIEKEGVIEVLEKGEAVPIAECTPNVVSNQTPVIDIDESPERKTAVVITAPQKAQPPPQTTYTSCLKQIPLVTTSTAVEAPPASISLTVSSIPSPTKTSRVTTTTTQTLQVTGIQRLQDRLGSPVNRTPNSVKSTPEKRSDSNETLSSGNYKIRNANKRNGDQPKQARPLQDATNETIDVPAVSDDSPYSPASSEGDDLFDPPPETGKLTQINSKPPVPYKPKPVHKDNTKPLSKFDLLFGPSLSPLMIGNKKSNSKVNSKFFPPSKKSTVKKSAMHKMDEDQLKILDELPSSAVELQVKDKFLKKLNRQERVVDEVKTVLKPHYARKHITKEEYKDILRRSVPKICHSKSGEINPSKIQFLIEAYVKKCRHAKKKLTNALS